MEPPEVVRAINAATAIAGGLGLQADYAAVLHNSNNLALRVLPCDVFARVAPAARGYGRFELELAERLAECGGPVAVPEPRVEPRPYELDGFEVTLWKHYESVPEALSPAAYAEVLARLHEAMRSVDTPTPHVTDRVGHAEQLVASPELTPALGESDREMLLTALRRQRQMVAERGAPEQLIHAEPHPGNVLNTATGAVFIDLETCCRGPVEFDLAHVPRVVSDQYPNVDEDLLSECRGLAIALVATWRWEPDDQLPNGEMFRAELMRTLSAGPPWPTLDEVFIRAECV